MTQEELKQRLIELLDELMRVCEYSFGEKTPTFEQAAKFLIANGVTIRERGEWRLGESGCMYFCPRCGYPVHPREQEEWDFCPHCGADMRGGKNE